MLWANYLNIIVKVIVLRELNNPLSYRRAIFGFELGSGSQYWQFAEESRTIFYYGGVAEWLKATDCKSVLSEYAGSNPAPSTIYIYTDTGKPVSV